MTGAELAIPPSITDTRQLAQFVLQRVPVQDRFAVAEAIRGIALSAIDTYRASPRGSLGQFFADTGLAGN